VKKVVSQNVNTFVVVFMHIPEMCVSRSRSSLDIVNGEDYI